ncbi:Proteophosphoglycan ppg4 [Rhodotorula toruloides ATCC 204091]|uniref:Proteophosphoglycan ppg4 n=1 Tax=Rhodotorula toruloides TaxID=5286 RepID=A0A0K3CAX6_RHOTO|nr:Proteophosphoglycan ppg4 [Rhodotorula toruloides ATCC 204091]KAK4333421.1 Proteophosphoglycan ppg4 [Rhodotorula toruloides]PRQ77462.1 Proteophosphoglycan ppg4 [Rhodotorula toruloides]
MGILSPQAYDQLFLEKCKLLLQAACNNSRRRGPDVSYEEFVESLDVRDEGSLRVFEVLLYETSTRRPPKRQLRSQSASTTERATERTGSTLQRRPRIPAAGRFSQILQDVEDSHSRDRQVSRSRMQDLLRSDSDDGSDAEHQAAVRRRRERLRNHRAPAEEADGTDDGISPSMRLRQQQLNELFGSSAEPPVTLHEMLGTARSIDSLDARWPSRPHAPSTSSSSSSAPLLPTFAELWSILTDEPFPSSSITSYSSFLTALNRCPSVTSATSTPLTAPGMRELLEELAQRDLAFPIRLTNLLQQREAARRAGGESGAGSDGSIGLWDAVIASASSTTEERHARLLEGEARGDTSSFLEGIWRAGFIEHIDDGGVPAPTDEGGDDATASTFADFTGRRRAERRRRDEAGGTASPAGSSSTPAITVTDASSAPTPATTAAHSPPPSSATDCPPARQTSASIAEAAFRSQRLIAPLPSSSSSTPRAVSQDQEHERDEMSEGQASLQAVFAALQRARERREEHGFPPNEVMM